MFIEDFFKNDDEGRKINKFARESCTYNAMYVFWRDNLFERVMRLFVWENTDPVPPKEIEQRLILRGHCGVLPFEGELTAFFGSFYGVTKYNDEKKFYNYRCPLYSNHAEIGKEIAIINNNALRNPVYPLVHHYAMLLAHNEVTIINTMINARDADGVPIAHTEKQKQSIQQYQSQRFNGQYGVVTDIGNLGVEYVDSDRKTVITLSDLIDNILDIGCGEGKDAVFFARNGYEVSAFDIAESGLEKARRLAEYNHVYVDFFKADIYEYEPHKEFDIIYSSGVFHYISPDKRVEIINRLKANTAKNGLHAINVFVEKPFLPKAREVEEKMMGHDLWRSGELYTYYHDWLFHQTDEIIFDCNSGGIPHKHCMDVMLAENV